MFTLPAWLLLSTLITAPADVDLVVFMAQGCPHCQQLRPELEELRTAGFRVQEVDALAHRSTAAEWKVESVPTLVVLRDQKEVDRIVGRILPADLLKRLQTNPTPVVNPFGSPAPTRSIGSISDTPSSPDDRLRNLNRESQVVTASANMPDPRTSSAPAASLASDPASLTVSGSDRLSSPRHFPNPSRPMNSVPIDSNMAKQKALAATVRLRIESETAQSNGSGTIIWSQNGEALVLTCGHIFRDMKNGDEVFVDFYRDGNWINAPGQVLQFFADQHDIGMVKCSLPFDVEPVGINYVEPLSVGAPAFSIGCDRGSPPAIQETQITCLNRYLGEANIEVDGAPVDGRSGGGLFDSHGNLVGICNAADHQDNEGIYAGQGQIVHQLQALSLQIPSATSTASPRFAQLDTTRGQNEWLPQPTAPAANTTATDPEVMMIVRDGKNPPREVRIAEPTPELLKWIDQQSSRSSSTSQHP